MEKHTIIISSEAAKKFLAHIKETKNRLREIMASENWKEKLREFKAEKTPL